MKSRYLNHTANYLVLREGNRKRIFLITFWRRTLYLSTREKIQRFSSLGEPQAFGTPCKAAIWNVAFSPWYTGHWQPLNSLLPLLIILHCDCLLLFSIYILLISQECKLIPRVFSISPSLFFVEITGTKFDVNQKCADMSFFWGLLSQEKAFSGVYFGSVWWLWNFPLKNSGHLFQSLWTSKFKLIESFKNRTQCNNLYEMY